VKHPNVVNIFDSVETNNHVNLVLELILGKALSSMYKASPLDMGQVRGIIYKVVLALTYLHELNITHRDIKLENVLYVAETQEVKLIDFGFSTLMKQSRKMFCGTPSYMAPEIVRRTQYVGQPVDIWALGVILYTLVT
jgi:MAP/microtubule affinity-regulating kinase